LRLENDEGGFPLLSYKWCEITLCPNGLLLLDFCITFYQEKVMKIKRCMKTTDFALLHAYPLSANAIAWAWAQFRKCNG
jgi:hypothetical protein